ncbi:phosphatase PAP2 family protein [Streptomyces sp. PCS3-D2]|uniref:phosphatase PAP2 family protein n=1 Tax=Streptomyces sp. PCS3-D2 TaxID=1460244 RepID=UPI00044C7A23|nr:phosphatase PAP2 family protein [Streptomyces sp. PCS3-D2]WKV74201.1 phosphatase PAP2 family protein [Streptomyces sp. PCS3-D2]
MTATLTPDAPTPARAKSPLTAVGTDVLEPRTWIIGVTLLMGWHADRLTGIGWGLVAAVFCGVVPMLWIKWGQRRGYWGDRHVRRRQDRLIVLPGVIISVATCITLMFTLSAPREMSALVLAMLATLVAILAITTAWKISVHTAVSAGALVMLAFAYGPWVLVAVPLVALVGWSRVVLRDHTLAQVLAGTVLGAVLAGAVFTWLR